MMDLRSAFLSSGDSDDKMPLASSIAMPTAQWWFSRTLASLYRCASTLPVFTWYAFVVPGCSRSWHSAASSSASTSSWPSGGGAPGEAVIR